MTDTKVGGGAIPTGQHVRIEFKVRGWLGQTKNLDGEQLEKDIDFLLTDEADLLVLCLSETAHRKWRGEGPPHQAVRRSGVPRFRHFLFPMTAFNGTAVLQQDINIDGTVPGTVSTRRVIASPTSPMPGAEHFVTLVWRRFATTATTKTATGAGDDADLTPVTQDEPEA